MILANTLINYFFSATGGVISTVIFIFAVYTLFKVWNSKKNNSTKVLWTLIVLFFPIIGPLAYLLLG